MNPSAPTPFNDPSSPGADDQARSTQPLPPPGSPSSQSAASQRAGALLSGLQSGAPTGHSATRAPAAPPSPSPSPSPAAPPSAQSFGAPAYAPPAQAGAPPSAPLAAPTSRLRIPLPTAIGLAVTGGVLLAILVPAAMRRAIPPAPMKTLPPNVDTPIIVRRPTQDSSTQGIPTQDNAAQAPPLEDGARAPAPPRDSAPDAQGAPAAEDAPPAPSDEPSPGPKNIDDPAASSRPAQPAAQADAPAGNPAPPDAQADAPSKAEGKARRKDERKAEHAERKAEGKAGRGGSLYSIAPPEGWRRGRSAGRATWRGPGGAQILVEVAPRVQSSPQEDWEKLSRAFERKYGPRYRSLGIHEATLAGRTAWAWEFELDSKGGATTRKIDVAMHAGGRGYAVLGSAPAARFDEVRPQLEAAINSFQLHTLPQDQHQDRYPAPDDGESSGSLGTAAGSDAQSEKGF